MYAALSIHISIEQADSRRLVEMAARKRVWAMELILGYSEVVGAVQQRA